MSFRNSWIRVGNIPFTDNGVATIDLPRGFLGRSLFCRLSGTVTVGVANATAIVAESPYPLIRRLEIIADGRDTIKSLTGQQLRAFTSFYYGGLPPFTVPGVAIGAQPFAAFFVVPFESPLARSPIDTLLDTRRYEQIQLRITWGVGNGAAGATTDLLDGAPTTTQVVSNCGLDVSMFQTAEPSGELFSLFRQTYQEQIFTASTTDFDFNIPVGNTIRSLLLRATTGDLVTAAGQIPTNAIIQDISLIADSAHFPVNRVLGAIVQEANAAEYRITDPTSAAGLTVPAGYYLLDFAEDGMLTAALQTADIASLRLRLNVAFQAGSTNRIQVVANEIIPANVADAVAASIGS